MCGQSVIHIPSDDADVFVLYAYWVNPANLQSKVSWSAGMDQYLASMPPVLILVKNTCSY